MQVTQKKARLIRQVMDDKALMQAVVNHVGKHRGDDKDAYRGYKVEMALKGNAYDKFDDRSTFNAIVEAAKKLNISVADKQDGQSLGIVMRNEEGNEAVYIKNDITNREDKALTFAFVSKLLHKMGIGPLCDFVYDQNTKQLITFSAQIGYSKNKKFVDGNDFDHNYDVENAIQAIEKYLVLDDAQNEPNCGFTIKDDKIKPKILDFTVTWNKSNFSSVDIEQFTTNLKSYLKGWQEDEDDLNTYMKRQFAKTLGDEDVRKLFDKMSDENKAKLNEYCQQIVGLSVEQLENLKQLDECSDIPPPLEDCTQEQSRIETFKEILTELQNDNKFKGKLTDQDIQQLFIDARDNKGYTRKGLPSHNDDGNQNLKRQFSVAFQRKCAERSLYFTNRNEAKIQEKEVGMGSKSAIDYLGSKEKMKEAVEEVWR